MFGRFASMIGKRNSNRYVRRNRTLSANLDPRNIPSTRPATRSFRNSMLQKSKALGNRMRTTRTAVRNSMRTTRTAVGTAINSMKLTHGARRRVRNRRDEVRRNILEREIVKTIKENKEKTAKDLKKELLRNLDEKINFRIHSGENFYTYYTCDRSTKNETMVDDYSYIINQMIYSMYYDYSLEIKNVLIKVKEEVDSRMHHCKPTERKHT
jgi:hypothetical protein